LHTYIQCHPAIQPSSIVHRPSGTFHTHRGGGP
jgi:hypothetical protein